MFSGSVRLPKLVITLKPVPVPVEQQLELEVDRLLTKTALYKDEIHTSEHDGKFKDVTARNLSVQLQAAESSERDMTERLRKDRKRRSDLLEDLKTLDGTLQSLLDKRRIVADI